MNNYFMELTNKNSKYSSKSLAMLVSIIIGAVFALMLGSAVLIDVIMDGKIDSDMTLLGMLLTADGIFMVGGSVPKAIEAFKQ